MAEELQVASLPSADDPLLECLQILTRLHNQPLSTEALKAGLPLRNSRLTVEVLPRAAERAGLATRVTKRKLGDISPLFLPVIVLLKDGRACVMTRLYSGRVAEVIYPEFGYGTQQITLDELNSQYLGYVVFARPLYRKDHLDQDQGNRFNPKSWFWGSLKQYKSLYFQVLVAAFMINILALVTPLFTMNVYDRVIPNHATATLWVLLTGALIMTGFDFLIRLLRSYFLDRANAKADVLISGQLFAQVLGTKLSHKPASTGSFAEHLRSFESLRDFFTSASLSTVVDLPFAFVFLAVIFMISPGMVLIPIGFLPFLLVVNWLGHRSMFMMMRKNAGIMAERNGFLIETLENLETVKGLRAESLMQGKWEMIAREGAELGAKTRLLSSGVMFSTSSFVQIANLMMIAQGVYLIKYGSLSLGGLMACTMLSGRVLGPLTQIAGTVTRYQQVRATFVMLNKLMENPIERPKEKTFIHQPVISGKFEFSNASFSYPGQKLPSLQEVNLTIQPGEHIGIIGRVGSGKSTLTRIMMGFYSPTQGSLMIDGLDAEQIDPADIRRAVAYVPQDIRLFQGSVRDNIVIADPSASDDQILLAAKLAGVDTFVSRHPDGYAMQVGENGGNLSGGQRQAIAVARAFLMNAPVTLLDEPTGEMDHSSEQELIRQIKLFTTNKTLIVTTHRPNVLAMVDRLLVMHGGKIVMDGPKDQVLRALSGPNQEQL